MDPPAVSAKFPSNVLTVHRIKNMTDLFIQFEDLAKTELMHSLDIVYLELYLKLGKVPRGLSINIPSAFPNDTVFTKEWEQLLANCSKTLITRVINKITSLTDNLTAQIIKIGVELELYTDLPEYHNINVNLQKRLEKLEQEIIQRKAEKLANQSYQQYKKNKNNHNTVSTQKDTLVPLTQRSNNNNKNNQYPLTNNKNSGRTFFNSKNRTKKVQPNDRQPPGPYKPIESIHNDHLRPQKQRYEMSSTDPLLPTKCPPQSALSIGNSTFPY
ncbi:hypothetical protein GDO81_011960 [Engystomops pustulosus]|uniref:Gag protein n=1 Tax=Engystomops pustulosus TaxID=76066 RepID=A0AAV7BI98_ENGPU|nr:hypothetical protein GDO81_011960 [Engystomops pustulosus]